MWAVWLRWNIFRGAQGAPIEWFGLPAQQSTDHVFLTSIWRVTNDTLLHKFPFWFSLILVASHPGQLKRWRAPVKRDLVVWVYDVSKQALGAMFIHVWNIILSIREVSHNVNVNSSLHTHGARERSITGFPCLEAFRDPPLGW